MLSRLALAGGGALAALIALAGCSSGVGVTDENFDPVDVFSFSQGGSGTQIGQLTTTETLTVKCQDDLGTGGVWYEISFSGGTGWVDSDGVDFELNGAPGGELQSSQVPSC